MSKRLALTIGDPTGIGPEITAKLLDHMVSHRSLTPMTIFGDIAALNAAAHHWGLQIPEDPSVNFVDITGTSEGDIAFRAVVMATEAVISGSHQALVTGPISKENWHQAGRFFSGHTELLEWIAREHFPDMGAKAQMLFIHDNLRMMLLTRHIALEDVSQALIQHSPVPALKALAEFLRDHQGISEPNIAVMGLNPHAGEVGGVEEILVLRPALEALNDLGIGEFSGPFAADALMRGLNTNDAPYDAYVACYHDQGLIPMKLLAGYDAVNVTIGLPFIRTSVSHGTAPDIAGQGIASAQSLIAAVNQATRLSTPSLVPPLITV